jgi:hypothetical protein
MQCPAAPGQEEMGMTLRGRVVTLAVASILAAPAAMALAQTQTPPAATGSSSSHRLFLRFVEDAALVPSYWLEGQARWQTNTGAFGADEGAASEANTLSATGVFAMNVAEDFEFGGRIGLAHRDPDDGSGETGLTDMDLWGKVSVATDPMAFSVGLLVTAPTGSEDKFLGTGETNVEFFGGVRKALGRVTLAGNLGMRINQDADFDEVELEGQNSLLGGAAVLVEATRNVGLILEYAVESARYEGTGTDARLLGGFDWSVSEQFLVRGGVAGGLSNGAPDVELIGSAAWLF